MKLISFFSFLFSLVPTTNATSTPKQQQMTNNEHHQQPTINNKTNKIKPINEATKFDSLEVSSNSFFFFASNKTLH